MLTLEQLQPPTSEQLIEAQNSDADIDRVRQSVENSSMHTPDELGTLSPKVKALAQLLPELFWLDDVQQLSRCKEPTRIHTVVHITIANSVTR